MEERQSRLSSMVWRRFQQYFCVRLIPQNSMFSNFCHVLNQLLKNSFKIGEKYTREYIKKELKRLYALVKTAPKNAITAMTIKDFFKIQECKIGNQKAIRILEPLI